MIKGKSFYVLSKPNLASFIVAVVLTAFIGGGAAITFMTGMLFQNVSDEWHQQQVTSEDRGRYQSDILRHFGYGGFIHNFKNYILRQTPDLREKLANDLVHVWAAVSSLESVLKNPEDLQALSEVKNVIRAYQDQLATADAAARNGSAPRETDFEVRVDDTAALQALWSLRDSWQRKLEADRARFARLVSQGLSGIQIALLFIPILIAAGLAILWFIRRLTKEITERQRAEEELRRGELIVESLTYMGQGVSVMDKDLKMVACNGMFLDVLDFPAEFGLPGVDLADIFRFNAKRGEYGSGDIEEQVRERLELAAQFIPHIFERTRPNGAIIEVEGTPLPQGGFVTTYTDVTSRKLAEVEIARKETQLATALGSMSAGILFFDKDQKIRLFNDAVQELLDLPDGLLRDGLLMRALLRFRAERGEYGDGNPEDTVQAMLDAFRSGDFRQRDTRATADGKSIDVFRAATPDGGVVIVYNDVTERHQIEEKLRRHESKLTRYIEDLELSQSRLEERSQELVELAEKYAYEKDRAESSERSKSEFLASMSHEIRTPMTGILGLADILLERGLSLDDEDTVYKIKGAGQSLLTIINDILDLSKLEAGKLEIEQIDFHLPSVINDAVDLVRPKADDKNLALAIDITTAMPNSVCGDPTRIRQILINLLGNAVKFTNAGSVVVKVRHEVQDGNSYTLRFSVIDTGIGIPASAQDSLFQDFTQADASTTREFEGTGLGLAISRRLSGLMGGKIGVESAEGEGSTFWFTVSAKEATTEVEAISANLIVQSFQANRSLDILIAEDNELNQMIINSVLAPLGHELKFVGTGVAAINAVKSSEFDIVLMDIRMPEMGGADATRAIRLLESPKSQIPIVAVTADVLKEHVASYLDAGMNAAVTKPIDRADMLRVINKVLDEEIHLAVQVSRENSDPQSIDIETRNTDPHADEPEVNEAVEDFLKHLAAAGR